jgi:hypothetical protein
MRVFIIVMTGCVLVGMTGLCLANPALLPDHPGYPSRGAFAYDTEQPNLTRAQSLQDAAESENANIVQQLEDPSNPELLRQEGAGLLPSSQAPHGKMGPLGAEMKQVPK